MNAIQQGVARALAGMEVASSFAVGDTIEVISDDGQWYPGKVKAVKGVRISVVYDGESEAYTVSAKFARPKKKPGFSITPARYAKGQMVVQVDSDGSGYKNRGHRIAEELNGRWSNRSKGYVMSPTKAEKFAARMAEEEPKQIAPVDAAPAIAPPKKEYTRADFTDAQFKLATKAWTKINDLISAFGEKQRMKIYEVHHLFQTIRPKLMADVVAGQTNEDTLVHDALESVKLGKLTKPAAKDPNIGRKWLNANGIERTITDKIMIGGRERYTVRDADQSGRGGEELIDPDELEDRVATENRLAESNTKFREGERKSQADRDTKEADRRSLDGFEDTFTTPMARERAIKTLTDKSLKVNGRFYQSRKAAIRDLVLRKGYKLDTIGDKRVLKSPVGSFFDDKILTKIGFDYAEHLTNGGGK